MDDDEKDSRQLRQQLADVRSRRILKQLSLLQDSADAAIAVNDIRGKRSNPTALLFVSD